MLTGLCTVTSILAYGTSYVGTAYAAKCDTKAIKDAGGLIPELKTVVPQQLQIVNDHQNVVLRFSNGIANTGKGVWEMVPVIPADKNNPQGANQTFRDANGNKVGSCTTGSESVYHPAHKHFHISGVALFEVHALGIDGKVIGNSLKVTSCLIDWVRLQGNSPDNERVYNSCDSGVQGISPGWVDQYHMATEGQSIDITKAPAGKYYLVSTANPEKFFVEVDNGEEDNKAWVSFDLSRDSTGNPKIAITGHSDCSDGLCGEDFPNR
jgi:hypothetical protein